MQYLSISPFLLCAALAGAAQAQQSLEPVQISGKAVRTDVRSSCPSIQASLNDNMAAAIGRVGKEGEYLVSFVLEDGRISQVQSRGSDYEYRPFIRRAVSRLECRDGIAASTPQRYAFVLAVRTEDSVSTSHAALREPTRAELVSMGF